MRCPRCDFETAADARFCQECGSEMGAPRCSSCQRELPGDARFCPGCGSAVSADARATRTTPERAPRDYTPKHLADRILQQKAALEGEKKQVTVLFADVKGSVGLSGEVDAEEWHRVMDRFLQILSDGVHRFEGTVNQYTGDGIMALFGAPIAHEDHAQRACWAALHLKDALRRYANELRLERGLDFAVRMGLNSGEVVVGRIGDDLRMDYTAQGQTVGVAARMEGAAAAGSAYLSQATAELARGYFELEDLGETTVKGLDEPVHVFELIGEGELETRFDLSRARGLTRFVGREREMRTLEEALERAREGEGSVVGVVADAGIGKSRLCFEFAERCRALGLRVLEGHGLAHARDVPFASILQVMRGYYGIGPQDSDRSAREKVAGRLLLIDPSFREGLPVIFDFLGIGDPDDPAPPMDPDARERQLLAMVHRLVRAGTADRLVVTVIEDLHWMDAASEAFIAQWVDAVAGAHNLLVLNFRPEYRADFMQKPSWQSLPIRALGLDSVREFVVDHLGVDSSLADLPEAIHERTAGNPFFTEEVIRSLVESGQLEGEKGAYRLTASAATLELPASVQALLAARIDRLSEVEKQLIQTAAVIGRQFSEPILTAVVELAESDLRGALGRLKDGGFVYEKSLFPVAEYAFVHPLTQGVALRSQLGERRAQIHAAVAKAIEQEAGEKVGEQAALIAHHFEEAGERLTAARWHERAAAWAGVSRIEESQRCWGRVCALLPADTEDPQEVALALDARMRLLNFHWQFGASEEEIERTYREGRELAGRARDEKARALLEGVRAASLAVGPRPDVEQLTTDLREAVRMAAATGDVEVEAVNRWRLGYALSATGRLAECLENSDHLLELTAGDWRFGYDTVGFSAASGAATYMHMAACMMGRVEDAKRAHDLSVRIQGELEHVVGKDFFSMFDDNHAISQAQLFGGSGEFVAIARRSVEAADKWGNVWVQSLSHSILANAYFLEGRYAEAIEAAEHSASLSRERQTAAEMEPERLEVISASHRELGELDAARAAATKGIASAQRIGARPGEIGCRLALAKVLVRRGERAPAEAELDATERLIDETGAEAFRPVALLERAALARQTGDETARRELLERARGLYAAMPAPVRVREVEELLGSCVRQ